MMNFSTAAELLECCRQNRLTIAQVMIRREIDVVGGTEADIRERMDHSYQIMKNAVRESLENPLRSMGGLIGGEAKKMNSARLSGKSICGPIMAKAAAYSMGVLEVNASMGLIVAAPTAGSAGVIPGTFLPIQEEYGFEDDEMVDALFTASAVGYLIMRNATVAGAQGGCQAEIGSASAMAAASVAGLMKVEPEACLGAAAIALTNMMGLVCDPIAGLVEAPCQKRNATGASNALLSAEMVLSGISSLLPLDEVIEAMYKVGLSMPQELRETALGGVAACPTACKMCQGIFEEA